MAPVCARGSERVKHGRTFWEEVMITWSLNVSPVRMRVKNNFHFCLSAFTLSARFMRPSCLCTRMFWVVSGMRCALYGWSAHAHEHKNNQCRGKGLQTHFLFVMQWKNNSRLNIGHDVLNEKLYQERIKTHEVVISLWIHRQVCLCTYLANSQLVGYYTRFASTFQLLARFLGNQKHWTWPMC